MDYLLNLIFPSKCLICNQMAGPICSKCLNTACLIKDQEKPKELIGLFEYKDVVRKCIKLSKYRGKYFSLIKELTKYGLNSNPNINRDSYKSFLAVPIPLSREKQKIRGFNQAEKIAEVVGNFFKIKVSENALYRTKNTFVQHGMTREQRFSNMKDAFTATKNEVVNKDILLVDDVCTTGATFAAATEALYKAGAKNVGCLSLSIKSLERKGFKKTQYDI